MEAARILRAVPDKLGGVIAMFASILILFFNYVITELFLVI